MISYDFGESQKRISLDDRKQYIIGTGEGVNLGEKQEILHIHNTKVCMKPEVAFLYYANNEKNWKLQINEDDEDVKKKEIYDVFFGFDREEENANRFRLCDGMKFRVGCTTFETQIDRPKDK